jgi:hypothetical protein
VRKTIWINVRPETEVMFREAKQAVQKERGERLDEDAVLEVLYRAFLSGVRTSSIVAAVGVRPLRSHVGMRVIRSHVGVKAVRSHVGVKAARGRRGRTTALRCTGSR